MTATPLSAGEQDDSWSRLHGWHARFPVFGWRTIVSWLTGFVLLLSVLRIVLISLGFVRELDVELGEEALRVRRRTRLFGRLIQSGDEVYPLSALRRARRSLRYPTLQVLVGAFCFALGLALGGLFAVDAARAGDSSLWMIAAVLVLSGIGIDGILTALVPGGRRRVAMELDFGPRARVQLAGIRIEDADRFLEALWRAVSRQSAIKEGTTHAVDQSKLQGH